MTVKVAPARIERKVKEERLGVVLRLKPGRGQWTTVGTPATMAAFEAKTRAWVEATSTTSPAGTCPRRFLVRAADLEPESS